MLKFILIPKGAGEYFVADKPVDITLDWKYISGMPFTLAERFKASSTSPEDIIQAIVRFVDSKNVLMLSFEELVKLDQLNNFENFTEKLLDAIDKVSNCFIVSTTINQTKEWLKERGISWIEYSKMPPAAFLAALKKYNLEFHPIESAKLYELSFHRYIYAIAFIDEFKRSSRRLDWTQNEIEWVILSKLSGFLEYLFDWSLSRCRGDLSLRSILGLLASAGPLRTKDIAEKLERNPGQISGYMQHLKNSDLIRVENRFYQITDPLFAWWIAYKFGTKLDVNQVKLNFSKRMALINFIKSSTDIPRALKMAEHIGPMLVNLGNSLLFLDVAFALRTTTDLVAFSFEVTEPIVTKVWNRKLSIFPVDKNFSHQTLSTQNTATKPSQNLKFTLQF